MTDLRLVDFKNRRVVLGKNSAVWLMVRLDRRMRAKMRLVQIRTNARKLDARKPSLVNKLQSFFHNVLARTMNAGG